MDFEVFKEFVNVLTKPCIVNLDLQDMYDMMQGKEKMAAGMWKGKNIADADRVVREIYADKELGTALTSATDIWVNFSGDLSLGDVNSICSRLVKENVNILLSALYDNRQEDIKLTIVAVE